MCKVPSYVARQRGTSGRRVGSDGGSGAEGEREAEAEAAGEAGGGSGSGRGSRRGSPYTKSTWFKYLILTFLLD